MREPAAIHRFRFWAGDEHVDIDVSTRVRGGCVRSTASSAAFSAWMRAQIHLRAKPTRVEHIGSLT